jgi:hypothetical protein
VVGDVLTRRGADIGRAALTAAGRGRAARNRAVRGWLTRVRAAAPLRNRRLVALIGVGGASGVVSGWLIGAAAMSVSTHHSAQWILGRAAGITSYLLLVGLVSAGLVLSHPWRARFTRPSSTTRIRLHVSLAAFTFAFTVLHIVVLATDPYAGVGWWGTFVPMGASYRPVWVSLGVIGLYAGLAAGVTASLSGRLVRRIWWPVHKVSAGSLVLVWLHGLLAGSDAVTMRPLYLATGVFVAVLALTRYAARTPSDRVAELTHPVTHGVHDLPYPTDPRPTVGLRPRKAER